MIKDGYKKTELGWVPEEWEIRTLGEISNGKGEYGIGASATNYEVGNPRYLRISDIGDACNLLQDDIKGLDDLDYEKYILSEGDIVFARTGNTTGKSYVYNSNDGELVYAGFLIKFTINNTIANHEFVKYIIQSKRYWDWVKVMSTRSGQPGINSNEYYTFKVQIPPLKEQQKIAEILSTVDSQIDDTDKLIEKTKELKKGLMQQLLTKGIGHKEFKKTEIGEIPVEWEAKCLKEISTIKRGASPRPIKDTKWFSEEKKVGWIRISDVTASSKYLTETTQYLSEEGIKKSRPVKVNDLIMSICATVGKPIIMKMNACIHDGFVLLDDLDSEKYDKEFLYYVLQKYEESFKSMGQTGTQSNLNSDLVGGIVIGVPTFDEQKQIANILSSVDTEIQEYENKKAKLEELKKGLMQQLLSGKVRVI